MYCLKVDSPLTIRLSGRHFLPSPEITSQVESIWQDFTDKNPGLSDGDLLFVDQYNPNNSSSILCFTAPYRYFFAQRKDALIRERLNLQGLAVSGIIDQDDCLLFGQRSSLVTQYKNFWELVPSGSLSPRFLQQDDTINFTQQLAEEFCEELSGNIKDIVRINPEALIFDDAESTLDILSSISVHPNFHHPPSTDEYQQILKVSKSSVDDWVEKKEQQLVPTSLVALRHLRII